MDTKISSSTRSRLDSLAGVNEQCELYGQAGQNNLIVRKTYGHDRMRYLRCQVCRAEFSERKQTALWNTKVAEAKAIAVGEHLAAGCSLKGTVRLVKVDASTVRRLSKRLGEHGQSLQEGQVRDLQVAVLEADERHGYATNQREPVWEAELIDPASKFVLSHVQGRRNQELIRRLLTDGATATPATPPCSRRSLGNRTVPAATAREDGHPRCAFVFLALWLMPSSSSTGRASARSPSKSATPMAAVNGPS